MTFVLVLFNEMNAVRGKRTLYTFLFRAFEKSRDRMCYTKAHFAVLRFGYKPTKSHFCT